MQLFPHNIVYTRASIDGEVGYGQELFAFQNGRRRTCKTIYATDDRVSDGTQISRLLIDAEQGTTVPFVIHPQSIPIIIIDNDGEDANAVCMQVKATPQN